MKKWKGNSNSRIWGRLGRNRQQERQDDGANMHGRGKTAMLHAGSGAHLDEGQSEPLHGEKLAVHNSKNYKEDVDFSQYVQWAVRT